MDYLFKTERLGFRNWKAKDIEPMYRVNSDAEVMRYFPSTQDKEKTSSFIQRMQAQFDARGYCYFATDILDTQEMIGFIGMAYQTYEAPFTPAVDIGWRLDKKHWGKGYATEGAKGCLNYAFECLNIQEVISIASSANVSSINVMKKIGMKHEYDFDHSLLLDYPKIRTCSLYSIKQS